MKRPTSYAPGARVRNAMTGWPGVVVETRDGKVGIRYDGAAIAQFTDVGKVRPA